MDMTVVYNLWPELEWISDVELRQKTAATWALAFSKSTLLPEDLDSIPFTLLVPDCSVSFMTHKRAVVHLAKKAGEEITRFFGKDLPVNMDVLIAGAILADVGKLLEYEKKDGKIVQGSYGKFLRHPFSGVALAEACGVPPEVTHIIAAHAGEGDLVKRSVEATIVHHCDFMTFLPFKDRLK
ncbi:MAG: HDIG domain-containing metalloprotein [Bacteroidales bacterium]|nr:HDIG domain-containing protein [Bacteroidales bacterium]HQK37733.1 HDIG domain-containing protein [Bacteroidales bacterium]